MLGEGGGGHVWVCMHACVCMCMCGKGGGGGRMCVSACMRVCVCRHCELVSAVTELYKLLCKWNMYCPVGVAVLWRAGMFSLTLLV